MPAYIVRPSSYSARTAPGPPRPAPGPPTHWVRDYRYSGATAVLVWTLVITMIVPWGFDYASLANPNTPPPGTPASGALWFAMLGAGSLILAWRRVLSWRVLSSTNIFLMLFLALAFASMAWSIEPGITLRRLVRVLTFFAVAFAFVVVGWHVRRFQNLMRPVLTFMLAGSLIFGLLSPGFAIHQSDSYELIGAWRGLTTHKNQLGALASTAVILWAHAFLVREVGLRNFVIGGGISLACLLLSRSSTAFITTVFVVLFLLMLLRSPKGLRPYMPWVVALFVIALLGYSMAILRILPGSDTLLKPITFISGKDATFTGRSQIWEIVVDHIRTRPLFGSGYGAYWSGLFWWSPSYDHFRKLYFYPGSAHNGYLEVLIDLGIVGLFCLIGFLIAYVAQCLRLWRIDRGQAALYLGVFFQQAIANLSESHWLSVKSVEFLIVTFASMSLARTLLEVRMQTEFGNPHRVRVARPVARLAPSVARPLP